VKKLLLLALGSNLGDRFSFLELGCQKLEQTFGELLAKSPVYETEPFGVDHKTTFLNQVLAFQTGLEPLEILKATEQIEKDCGRNQKRDLQPRSLDIDILSLGNEVFESSELIIPHPAIEKRRFVLVPLLEVCPFWIHPKSKKSGSDLLKNLSDTSWIKHWR